MVFSNLFFLYIFLPANIILYFAAPSIRVKNAIMVCFSLFFYAWGEPVWVFLLIATAFVNWLLALHIKKHLEDPERRKARCALVAAVVLDLSLLLPIGISFYTFQIISYMADVYRRDVEAQPSFVKFLMYVTMYHQLVAGPIVRYQWIAQEIDHRKSDPAEVWGGLCRFCVGLCKKVVVANAAGKLAGQYLDGDLARLTTAGAFFGILMFTLQIYYDFSAYSDMAIGMGRIFGFHYMENFNYPYIARSVTGFWRRWHISLSSFFRDYVYIPLGGKYRHQLRNICVVWLLTGLWHGASWNFVLWGLYFFVFLVLEKLFLLPHLEKSRLLGHVYLLFLVVISWAIFAITDFAALGRFLAAMFSFRAGGEWVYYLRNYGVTFLLAAVLSTPLLAQLEARWGRRLGWLKNLSLLVVLIASIAYLEDATYNPFLYFRF